MMDESDQFLASLPTELRAAFSEYCESQTQRTWSILSQIYVGNIQVLDAVQRTDPTFEDAFPLEAADLVKLPEDLQWPRLPDSGLVLRSLFEYFNGLQSTSEDFLK